MGLVIGKTYFIKNVATGKYLNVYGSNTVDNGRNVTLYSKVNEPAQKWIVTLQGAGAVVKTTINTAFGLNINQYDNGNCTMWPLSGNAADSELDFLTVDAAQNKYHIKMLGVHNKFLRPNGSGDLANVYWSATNDDWCLWQIEEEGSYSSTANVLSHHYTTSNPFYISDPGLKGQCTWYAAGRVSETIGKMPSFSQNYGRDAINWPNLITNGTLSQTPQKGGVIIWANSSYGHVAVIENVSGNTITFTECNGSGSSNGVWNEGVDGIIQTRSLDSLKSKYSGFKTFINF